MLIARDLNIIGAQSLKVNKLEVVRPSSFRSPVASSACYLMVCFPTTQGAHPLELSRSVESTWFLRFFLQVTAGL